jgi:hypothetical protein
MPLREEFRIKKRPTKQGSAAAIMKTGALFSPGVAARQSRPRNQDAGGTELFSKNLFSRMTRRQAGDRFGSGSINLAVRAL